MRQCPRTGGMRERALTGAPVLLPTFRAGFQAVLGSTITGLGTTSRYAEQYQGTDRSDVEDVREARQAPGGSKATLCTLRDTVLSKRARHGRMRR
jgi:hypothetical protein